VLLLAADTSSPVLTVALVDGTRLLAETYVECDRKHSERLLGTVDWALNQAGATFNDVDAFAIASGPGSFTGLRIGIAAFKGFALAQNKPLAGVPTLPVMACAAGVRDGLVCPLLDARMGEVFGAVYSFKAGVRTEVVPMQAIAIDSLLTAVPDDALFVGAGAELCRDHIGAARPNAQLETERIRYPRASWIASDAVEQLAKGAPGDAASVVPIYLRGSQAETARGGG
jgi:tRNA threonylcarbamoyladenosine biosynthesis protein TsaB